MKSISCNDRIIELYPVRFFYGSEQTAQEGVLVHDSEDKFHDGDAIYGNGWTLDIITDKDDVESLLTSDDGTTYFEKLDNGEYKING